MKLSKSRRKVALVTGAGRRLGRQIALALGKSGFNVIVNYNASEKGAKKTIDELKTMGVHAISVKADISKKRDVDIMVAKAISTFHRIDLLVNNSSLFIYSPLYKTSEIIWDTTLDTNLKGMFLCSQAVSKHMLKQKKGTIINIASLGGIQAWTQHLPYSVSKAGVIMLTKILAKTLAPHVLVNAIAPGTIIIEGEENTGTKKVSADTIPLKKYGNPEDITDLVIFLATKARYITGQIISADGGRSIQ